MAGLTREQRAAREEAKALAEAALPRVSVLERRLQNPFGEPSAPVRLKAAGLFPRWFNTGLRAEGVWRAKELGWSGVTPAMVVDLSQIGMYTVSPDGYVARGERAQEVLMCMPEKDYQRLQYAKTKKNLQDMRDVRGEQHRMMEAASKQFGGDFAEDMSKHVGPVGQVTDNLERIERTEPE